MLTQGCWRCSCCSSDASHRYAKGAAVALLASGLWLVAVALMDARWLKAMRHLGYAAGQVTGAGSWE